MVNNFCSLMLALIIPLVVCIETAAAASVCPVTIPAQSTGAVLHVATTGNDSLGNGTELKPYASLKRAANAAKPGNTVLIHGGTYPLKTEQYITARGTADAWITIRPAAGEKVIFDAAGASLPDLYRGIITFGGAYVVFDGFEVKNSPSSGIKFYLANNIFVRNCRVHDVKGLAIGGSGRFITIQGNEVYNAVMSNYYGAKDFGSGGWLPAVTSGHFDPPSAARSEGWLVENNYIHNVWGECLDAMYLQNSTFRNNRVRDCYSANIYVDNASNIRIDGNYSYTTSDTHNTKTNPRRAHGIVFAYESRDYDLGCDTVNGVKQCVMKDIKITNNLVTSTHNGILYFNTSSSGYRNVTLAHNVVYDQRREAVWMAKTTYVSGNNILRNNILYKGYYTGSVGVNNGGWTYGYNDWPYQSIPSYDINGKNVNPQFVSPVLNGPATGFQLKPESALKAAGIPLIDVPTDFWCTLRNKTTPSIGIFEIVH